MRIDSVQRLSKPELYPGTLGRFNLTKFKMKIEIKRPKAAFHQLQPLRIGFLSTPTSSKWVCFFQAGSRWISHYKDHGKHQECGDYSSVTAEEYGSHTRASPYSPKTTRAIETTPTMAQKPGDRGEHCNQHQWNTESSRSSPKRMKRQRGPQRPQGAERLQRLQSLQLGRSSWHKYQTLF